MSEPEMITVPRETYEALRYALAELCDLVRGLDARSTVFPNGIEQALERAAVILDASADV